LERKERCTALIFGSFLPAIADSEGRSSKEKEQERRLIGLAMSRLNFHALQGEVLNYSPINSCTLFNTLIRKANVFYQGLYCALKTHFPTSAKKSYVGSLKSTIPYLEQALLTAAA
ncbi:MAG: hypothetical protein KI786_12075, partial [Mameliella sp.]|nr:hypothetical protein [Phaeodactylibacter sp.]